MIQKITIVLVALLLASCSRHGEDELWLVPEGYTGWLVIIPNRADGVPKRHEGGRLVFEFPKSGVLKTQFGMNYGMHSWENFTVSTAGERTKLFYTYNGSDLDRVRDGEPYLFGGFSEKNDALPYREFFAIILKVKGRKADSESLPADEFLREYAKKAKDI